MGQKLVTSAYDREDFKPVKTCPIDHTKLSHAPITNQPSAAPSVPVHRPINKEMLKNLVPT